MNETTGKNPGPRRTTRHVIGASITAATLGAVLLTGCGTGLDDDTDDCDKRTTMVMFFGTDGHYHYGSPTGKVVPAAKVPSSATKVPGYKAPAAPKVPAAKVPAAPAPKAPAPRPAVRVGR
jgi:hypothetical protein